MALFFYLKIPSDLDQIEITLNQAKVPVQDTTYWCHVQRLDSLRHHRHHIVQFEPLVRSPGVVHHMEVFHCETGAEVEIPLYNGDCIEQPEATKVCSKVLALWALGASTFTYPPEAGLPIGGPGSSPYVRLEVHFSNRDLKAG